MVPQRPPPGITRLRQLMAQLKCGAVMPAQPPS
jgi:hypothetical protein